MYLGLGRQIRGRGGLLEGVVGSCLVDGLFARHMEVIEEGGNVVVNFYLVNSTTWCSDKTMLMPR